MKFSKAEYPPTRFLQGCLPQLPRGKVLDVAAGRGRHTLYLASQGFSVHAVDKNAEFLESIRATAQESGLQNISTQTLDLEADPAHPPEFSMETYDVVLVTLYLYRPLFPNLIKALKPGGMLVYETFLVENYDRYQRPDGRQFCLEPNELLELVGDMEIIHYEEGERTGSQPGRTAITARLLARKV